MEKNIFIPFKDTWGIPGTLVYPDEGNKFPAILLVHGFMTSRNGDRFMLAKIAEGLKNNGIASLRIDELSMGENKRSRKDYCISNVIEEVAVAYEYMLKDPLLDPERIGLIGHSMGGKVVLHSANLNPKVIVTLNGGLSQIARKKVNLEEAKTDEHDNTKYVLLHTSDGRTELLFEKFDIDMEEICKKDYPNYDGPLLIAYASKDPTADPRNSIDYYNQCQNPNKTLLCIEDCNHTFNAKTGDYTKLNELISKLNPWLSANLK